MLDDWHERDRPPCLERRYTFSGYPALREFLDQAADISEEIGMYPDLSFGRDYVNVTIHGDDDGLSDICRTLAERLESLHARLSGE